MRVAKENTWHETADIVIVGYGLAGAVAAIAAHDAGASVLILEKQPAGTHYSGSSMSGGILLCPTNADGLTEYMVALSRTAGEAQWTDHESIRSWAEYVVQNRDWLEGLGGQIKFRHATPEHPQLPGASSVQVWRYQGSGLAMMRFMYRQVESRGIRVRYQTPACRLLTREGRVVGVRATRAGGGAPEHVDVSAARAVILCCGGFEANEDMKLQYLKIYPAHFTGGPANTGDGIKMAQEVGADLWHMNCVSARLVARFDDFPIAFSVDFGGSGKDRRKPADALEKSQIGFVLVDRQGKRYMSENIKNHAVFYDHAGFDTHRLEFPRIPSYLVFDRRRLEQGPVASTTGGAAGPHQLYSWSHDNSEELRKGWITSGNTIAELAANSGISPSGLEDTIQKWNSYCRAGKDPEFARNPLDLAPLDSPPFYAVKLFPGGPNTQGGPRRNSRAQVVDPFNVPIPGLYSAGECGSVYGMLYPVGGSNLAECIAFGRIAAENAAREDRA